MRSNEAFGKIFYNRPLPNKTNANSQKLNEIAIHVDGLDNGSWRCIAFHTHKHTHKHVRTHTYIEEHSDNYVASFVMQWVFFCP